MVSHLFYRLFPVPVLLKMPHAGIDIADDAIRAIEYSTKKGVTEIHRFVEYPLAPGVVESGYVKDEVALVAALTSIKSKLTTRFVRASLPEEKLYLFKTEVPYSTNNSEIRQSIEFKLEENVPVSPSDAVFEFDIMPKIKGEGAKKPSTLELSVSVAPYKVVDAYLSAFTKAGFVVRAFEVQPKALSRAVLPTQHGTFLLLHIMNMKTGIYIVSDNAVCFTSTIPFGGAAITEAIQKTFSLSAADAAALKVAKGYKDTKESRDIFACASNTISAIKDEATRVVQYWRGHNGGALPIERIILSGQDALLTGFGAYMATNTGLPVEVADVWRAIAHKGYVPPLQHTDALNFVVAAGLAL